MVMKTIVTCPRGATSADPASQKLEHDAEPGYRLKLKTSLRSSIVWFGLDRQLM